MIPATSVSERAENNFNFLAVFTNSAKSHANTNIQHGDIAPEEAALESRLVQHINQSNIISTLSSTVIPAGRLFLSTRFLVTFRLTDRFAKHFVLLRGLFEFSRPKNIRITSNRAKQLFEIEVSESQAGELTAYVDLILESLTREIKFKEALKAVIGFEKRMELERATLYVQIFQG